MSRLHILLACSDPATRRVLEETLAQLGLEPVIATDVNEVRAALSQESPQLLICEEGLPEGGYREVLRLAKAIGSEVPVVVCSLLDGMDEYLEAMELGAFDFIARPCRRSDVEFILSNMRKNWLLERMEGTYLYGQAREVSREDEAVA